MQLQPCETTHATLSSPEPDGGTACAGGHAPHRRPGAPPSAARPPYHRPVETPAAALPRQEEEAGDTLTRALDALQGCADRAAAKSPQRLRGIDPTRWEDAYALLLAAMRGGAWYGAHDLEDVIRLAFSSADVIRFLGASKRPRATELSHRAFVGVRCLTRVALARLVRAGLLDVRGRGRDRAYRVRASVPGRVARAAGHVARANGNS